MSDRQIFQRVVFGVYMVAVALGLTACNDHAVAPVQIDDTLPPISTFSIGGTITGATGPLTLQNSNGTTVAAPGNGAFTFATQLMNFASYSVTVAPPPAGQTCTVANGSGNVAGANVTNIAVSCTNNQYTIGGTVSGLGAGKSVVLRALTDGMQSTLAVTGNGAFTFPEAFVNHAEFLVFVLTQPVNQTCTAAPETGDVNGAGVTNITVTCVDNSASVRNWGDAQTIIADDDLTDADTFRSPKVAYDAAGNALAIWEQDRALGTGNEIHFSRFAPGSGWSTPGMIPGEFVPNPGEQPFGGTRRKPQLAVAANGNAVAAWVENVYAVAVSFYTPSTGWSAPEVIFSNLVNGEGCTINPKVAIDASGNVLVVWQNSMVNGLNALLYNRYSPGTGWTAPNTTPRLVGELGFAGAEPELAMSPNGNSLAIWKQAGHGAFEQSQLWSSRYDMTSDTWTAAQAVDSRDSANPLYGRLLLGRTNVLLDAAGNATAVWSQFDGTRMHVVFNRLTGDTWGTPGIIETGNDTGVDNAYDVRATIDGSGNIMAMWLQVDEDEGHYVANRYVPGTGWGTQENIGQYAQVGHVANDTSFELVSNAAGQTVALWTFVSGIGAENVPFPVYLSANEYNPVNHSWGVEEPIDRHAEFPGDIEGDARAPAVAVDPSGNATAVWIQDNAGTESGIRTNRFE